MSLFRRKRQPVMENRYKPQVEERPEKPSKRERQRVTEPLFDFSGNKQKDEKGGRRAFRPLEALGSFLDGSVLTNKVVVKNIPFLLFITVIAILYITNSANAEKNRRESARISEELKELRYKYISTKSSVMYLSNPSQISLKLMETGIRENVVPPVKIFVKKKESDL